MSRRQCLESKCGPRFLEAMLHRVFSCVKQGLRRLFLGAKLTQQGC